MVGTPLLFTVFIASSFTLIDIAVATEAMRRPMDFQSKLSPNGPFHSNHTPSERRLVEPRATQMKSIGYFANWGVYGYVCLHF